MVLHSGIKQDRLSSDKPGLEHYSSLFVYETLTVKHASVAEEIYISFKCDVNAYICTLYSVTLD
jgi:hypothetical protein